MKAERFSLGVNDLRRPPSRSVKLVAIAALGFCIQIMTTGCGESVKKDEVRVVSKEANRTVNEGHELTTDNFQFIEIEYRDGVVHSITSPSKGYVSSGSGVALRIKGINRYSNVISIEASSGKEIAVPLTQSYLAEHSNMQRNDAELTTLSQTIGIAQGQVLRDITFNTFLTTTVGDDQDLAKDIEDLLSKKQKRLLELVQIEERKMVDETDYDYVVKSPNWDCGLFKLVFTDSVKVRIDTTEQDTLRCAIAVSTAIRNYYENKKDALNKTISELDIDISTKTKKLTDVGRTRIVLVGLLKDLIDLVASYNNRIEYLHQLRSALQQASDQTDLKRHFDRIGSMEVQTGAVNVSQDIAGSILRTSQRIDEEISNLPDSNLAAAQAIATDVRKLAQAVTPAQQTELALEIERTRSLFSDPSVFLFSTDALAAEGHFVSFAISHSPRAGTKEVMLGGQGVKTNFRVRVADTWRTMVSGGVGIAWNNNAKKYFTTNTEAGIDSVWSRDNTGQIAPAFLFLGTLYYERGLFENVGLTAGLGLGSGSTSIAQVFLGGSIRLPSESNCIYISFGATLLSQDDLNPRYESGKLYKSSQFATDPLVVPTWKVIPQLAVTVSMF